MDDPYLDLTPLQALERARDAGAAGEGAEYLERYLRWRLLVYLQDREGDGGELRSVLVAATRWARSEGDAAREASWHGFLELLRDAERTPAAAADLESLRRPAGRAAELLAAVAADQQPARPKDLAEELGMSRQQVGNLSRQLEAAGLIDRQRGEGRSSWIFATARGLRLAASLPVPRPAARPVERKRKARTSGHEMWNRRRLASAVGI